MVRTRREPLSPVLLLIFLVFGGLVSTASASKWWEGVSLNGDFRFRHEMIDEEGKDARHRQRIRARVSVAGDVAPGIGVVIQLATGSSDPVSTNQTLDNAGSTKSVGLDLAYAKMSHEKLPGFKLSAGKMKNPLFRPGGTELIWDGDWNPEGGALHVVKSTDDFTFDVIGAAIWLDERSTTDDSWLGAVQGLVSTKLTGDRTSITAGGSYFDFVNAWGYAPFYDAENPMGNSVVEDEDEEIYYANKFELVELFVEVGHKAGKTPVKVYVDFVTNTATDSLDTGWLIGFAVGKLGDPGTWNASYSYRRLEKDAVVGTFTDSDFRGGSTDGKGHEFGGTVQVAKNTSVQATLFLNQLGLNGTSEDFTRLQLDAQFKF